MNEPIISPWIFYWMDVLTTVKELPKYLVGLALLLCAVFVVLAIVSVMAASRGEEGEALGCVLQVSKRIAIGYLVIFTCFTIISIFIPNQETMYKMLITSQITPNNIEYLKNEVKATGQGLVDSITDASIKIIKAKESK